MDIKNRTEKIAGGIWGFFWSATQLIPTLVGRQLAGILKQIFLNAKYWNTTIIS